MIFLLYYITYELQLTDLELIQRQVKNYNYFLKLQMITLENMLRCLMVILAYKYLIHHRHNLNSLNLLLRLVLRMFVLYELNKMHIEY
ncbi:ORF MSV042 hypothetical protein [Melanoplus sanguinipes entomopoxvirus]|uniref:Uncharacterized protein n=1 Tax=Melanoplus sanguinipes entomopoxvirus TaxID=83191 RepID=Q9YW49_MSEPV|nr:ORF MSV042 hypothetical protein [Melanoplus sanguinipes entomopoxvirus]AAC97617.1 ORF MSV042 hypothetical protein [Melanoplus sanguinipes entomopoxvirus 'O']